MTKSTYQIRTGQRCTCKRGQERDNCAACEGTGWQLDFRAMRAQSTAKPAPQPDVDGAARLEAWLKGDVQPAPQPDVNSAEYYGELLRRKGGAR